MAATRRILSISMLLSIRLAASLLVVTVLAKTSIAQSFEALGLRWSPPQVDARIHALSTTPPCSLPDVLKQAGQRAGELIDHLQNLIAHERVRYEQTDRAGWLEMSASGYFDYLVDFGDQSVIKVKELRTPLDSASAERLGAVLDKGIPVLALIFFPDLQRDYEMSCEGSTQWNNQPVWVVHFRQIRGKHPRTMTMETVTEVHPRNQAVTETVRSALRAALGSLRIRARSCTSRRIWRKKFS